MKKIVLPIIIALIATVAWADSEIATMRSDVPLDETTSAPAVAKTQNTDIRQVRNYPEQPPIIPHKIDGYQIDLSVNQCMTCHSRTAIEVSQAPMISITHFMNRDGQFLATMSPRRHFCTQCHVTATDARLLVDNDFVDVDEVLDYLQRKGSAD